MALNQVPGFDEFGQHVCPRDFPHQDDPGKKRNATSRSDEKRVERGLPRFQLFVEMPNEQITRDRSQLPENEENEEILGHRDAEHCSREKEQEPEEAPDPVAPSEISGRVKHHQCSDAGNEKREKDTDRGNPDIPGQTDRRRPGQRGSPDFALPDGAGIGKVKEKAQRRHQRPERSGDFPTRAAQKRGEHGRCKESKDRPPGLKSIK